MLFLLPSSSFDSRCEGAGEGAESNLLHCRTCSSRRIPRMPNLHAKPGPCEHFAVSSAFENDPSQALFSFQRHFAALRAQQERPAPGIPIDRAGEPRHDLRNLIAERNAIHEQSSSRRAMLSPNRGRVLAHSFPDPDGSSVHVEQTYLIAACTALAVDTYRGQQVGLPDSFR